MNEIITYLDTLIPNPVCELEFHKDYELLMAVMLSAQTTDKRVNMVTRILFQKYPSLEDLAHASLDDIMEIIKPIGTYHKKASNVILIAQSLLKDQNGIVPNNRSYLESLPGVGRKTTNVVLSILFQVPCIAVDTHVSRVSKRLGLAKENDDVLAIEKKLTRKIPKEQLNKMHHQLLLFGRYYCKSQSPSCTECQLKGRCKYYRQNKKVV